jgi:hypothetical protein
MISKIPMKAKIHGKAARPKYVFINVKISRSARAKLKKIAAAERVSQGRAIEMMVEAVVETI